MLVTVLIKVKDKSIAEHRGHHRIGAAVACAKGSSDDRLIPKASQAVTFLLVAIISGVVWFAGSGCATVYRAEPVEPGTFAVPGDQAWISTGITLDPKQKLLIEEVEAPRQILVKGDRWQTVSARGTYFFDVETGPYPLEPDRLHDDRRYPGYCLIGRIGEDGAPFFVGSRFQGVAPQAGMLWLGINDPTPQRNLGDFRCRISLDYPEPPLPKPAFTEAETRTEALDNPDAPKPMPASTKPLAQPQPVPDANVVIIFVDGLRPDVAVEMAEWGHMPNFRELFLDNGAWVRNSFTVQPSLTLTSFSSMITGVYANRHGVKMQAYYDREADTYVNGLSVRYFTRFANEVKARGVKAIYDYFPDRFGSGAMPYEPLQADVLQMNLAEWFHRAINTAGYSTDIRDKMDEAQTRFALDLASAPQVKVMLVWLPSNDVVSEQTPHGQFGGARPTIARMDQDLGRIVERLKIRRRLEKTYFILVSDHGHAGGHDVVNQRFDVKREVFHSYLQMNVVGMWHRFDYPGAPARRLGAVSDSDGAVGIFLPLGSVDSGDLSIPNTLEQLTHYGLADGSQVNAVELFAEYSATGRWPLKDTTKRPVDFAVAKVDADTVLIHKTTDRQALIHARLNADGIFEFKYEPVRHYDLGRPLEPIASGDPLGYQDSEAFHKQVKNVPRWIENYHTGTEWLQATYRTEYPGCVDTLNLYFRWDGPVTEDSPAPSQPGILLFASKGWVFEPKINLANQHEATLGSRHGMAFRESTNHCLFVSGPGIRKGVIIETPHRILDIMPTVFQMMGKDPADAGMDGRPIREIWEGLQ
ncbi:MAG: alkaline phosphatase family protein [Planctomycetota bacterium]|nr:alkaline phosphatase family protein [Planctomycetota bacterium]